MKEKENEITSGNLDLGKTGKDPYDVELGVIDPILVSTDREIRECFKRIILRIIKIERKEHKKIYSERGLYYLFRDRCQQAFAENSLALSKVPTNTRAFIRLLRKLELYLDTEIFCSLNRGEIIGPEKVRYRGNNVYIRNPKERETF